MKQNAGMKRSRGRTDTRPQHVKHGHDSDSSRNDRPRNDGHRNEQKVRGNFSQLHEKYMGLARDAASSGDRVSAENFYQHADHYFRLMRENQRPEPREPRVEAKVVEIAAVAQQVHPQTEDQPKAASRRRVHKRPDKPVAEISEVVIN